MPGEILTWLDGAAVDALPLPDRGLEFGDGLFETLLLVDAVPAFLPLHLARLQRGLDVLRFPDCIERVEQYLADAVRELALKNWRYVAVRLTLTRGGGPRGYAPPQDSRPRCIVRASQIQGDLTVPSAPARLGECSVRLGSQPALAGLKHLNRLEQVLCALEAREQSADDAVMLDQDGNVVCVGTGNLFMVKGRRLLTPPIIDCGIHGTRRQLVMERWAPSLRHEVVESRFTLQDMRDADEVFYTNSLVGIRAVRALGELEWCDHPLCTSLFEVYRGELH
ncbi:MAG: aminodeoxychorismate lyase [Halioglobus sp.]|nr:aminodeoxychorismate lyase [Halioglobus sp.]